MNEVPVIKRFRKLRNASPKGIKYADIIRAEEVNLSPNINVIGGDDPSGETDVPQIVLEKNEAGHVVKIKVKCSCGKYAEVRCDYE